MNHPKLDREAEGDNMKGCLGVIVGNRGVFSSSLAKEGRREVVERSRLANQKEGGYICHSDHCIPNNISFKQYKRAIKLAKKYGKY